MRVKMKAKPGPSFKPWKAKWLASLDVGDCFQTRRPVKGIEWHENCHDCHEPRSVNHWCYKGWTSPGMPPPLRFEARSGDTPYQPGQVYYMREPVERRDVAEWPGEPMTAYCDGGLVYADLSGPPGELTPLPWTNRNGSTRKCDKLPAIFMPRLAARTFARCVDVRVERFGEISAADALSEGVDIHPKWERECEIAEDDFRDAYTFAQFFNKVVIPEIYGDDPPEWWFAYEFEKVEGE